MSERFSKDFLDYHGAAKRNIEANGVAQASFSGGDGSEFAPSPVGDFFTQTDKVVGSINSGQFYASVAYFINAGASPSVARANALMLQDMAKGNDTLAMKLINPQARNKIRYDVDIYSDMNNIRGASNQVGLTRSSLNSDSYLSRNILP